MNEPQFVISGIKRKQEKKKLHELKRFVKMFWFYEDIDRVYGGGLPDEKCHALLAEKQKEIEAMEERLNLRVV